MLQTTRVPFDSYSAHFTLPGLYSHLHFQYLLQEILRAPPISLNEHWAPKVKPGQSGLSSSSRLFKHAKGTQKEYIPLKKKCPEKEAAALFFPPYCRLLGIMVMKYGCNILLNPFK